MTANWNSVVDDSRNDIVFEGRNQNYGAYQIRRRYNWTVTIILGCMIGALLFGMGLKFVLGLKGEEVVKEPVLDMTTIDLTPPPDKNEPPPPPPPPPPPVMETVKFVPPVIKDDAVETDPPPPQDKLVETTVSTVTQEGDGDLVVVPSQPTVIEEKAPEIFTVVEEMPEFPGGAGEMMKYFGKNTQYPQMAREAGLTGKCYLNFVVDPGGNITNAKVVKGVPGCPECDKEALRVIKSMPNWKVGKQNGRAVPVLINVPFNFTLK